MALLTIENLDCIYRTQQGDLKAVEDVSFQIAKGRNFGLVGESGCGKSTLLKAVMGVLPSNAHIVHGRIFLEQVDVTGLDSDGISRLRWKKMAMITQSAMNALDPVYKVGEQIVEAIQVHEDVGRSQARERVEKLFDLVGIDRKRFSEFPHQFSGGMRQRAIIAMSLILNPAIVIADEPTTSLDVIVQDQIFSNIRRLQKEIGFSLFLVTHDIALVIENCDDIGVMFGGRLMEIGPLKAVIKTPFHPYTMGLKNSFPNIHNRHSDLIFIPGVPPSLLGELWGCRFSSRCPFATSLCWDETPPMMEVGPQHQAACHHVPRALDMREAAARPETWLRKEESQMTNQINKNMDAVYFAYGTLLLMSHMKEFCPSAESIGIMRLKGYRLAFAKCRQDPSVGGCTLKEDPGNTMYGVLYRLPAEELAHLDKVSGVDKRYWVPKEIVLLDEKGAKVPAITYVIPEPDWNFAPAEPYAQRIIVGAQAWPLPADYRLQLEMVLKTALKGK